MTICRLSQQSVVNWTLGNGSGDSQHRGLFLELSFQRQIGFYVLQVYIPLCIIVYASFLSFWLVKTENGKEITARTYLLGKQAKKADRQHQLLSLQQLKRVNFLYFILFDNSRNTKYYIFRILLPSCHINRIRLFYYAIILTYLFKQRF